MLLRVKQDEIFKDVDDDQTVFTALYCDAVCRDGFLVRAEDADASLATQVAKLIADDGAYADYFGYSVAISDGIAVVGATGDDDKGSSSGSAYVFEMSDSSDATSWTQVAKLTPTTEQQMIISVLPLLSATVPSSSEHTMTTIKGQILVPRTSSRRAILPTRPRGRKRRNSPRRRSSK